MNKKLLALAIAIMMVFATMSALADGLQEDFTSADTDTGAWTRWWVQDTSITEEQIHEEMADIADKGYGGIEVCNKGGYDGGLGTEEWAQMMDWVLDACEEYGLDVSFSYQNDSPISLPEVSDSSVEGEITVTDLVYTERYLTADDFVLDGDTYTYVGETEVPSNEIVDAFMGEDAEPTIAEQSFVAVTVAKVTGGTHVYESTSTTMGSGMDVAVTTTELDPDSMQQLEATYEDGVLTVDWTLDASENPEDYIIFAWFAQTSGTIINIFSESAAEELVEYWTEHYLTDRMLEYLETNTIEVFEDSIEISSSLDIVFTWSMLEEFEAIEEETGYNMLAYLPLAIGRSYGMNTSECEGYGFAADEDGNYADEQYWNEYSDILSDMFAENHVAYLSEAFAELGITYRVQAYSGTDSNFYNTTYTAAVAVASGGITEGETLAYALTNDGYDAWRYLSGGAHMAGGQLISNEYAAVGNYGWRMTFRDMVDIVNKSVAGGANLFTNHGYNSDYETDEWPGYHSFADMFSAAWDDRDTTWEYFNILSDYLNRLQVYAQNGTAQLDLAVWHSDKGVMAPYFQEVGITDYGYNYEFLNSTVLDSELYPLAVVTNNTLAEEGSAYKAMILYNQTYLDSSDMEILAGYAEDGLPIIFMGDLPSFTYSLSETILDEGAFDENLEALLAMDNVYTVEDDASALNDLLISLGIEASASYSDAVKLENIHRTDEDGEYYWFYNTTEETISTTVTLVGEGTPYVLDLWTGEISAVADYTAEDGTVTMDLTLEGLDSICISVSTVDLSTTDATYAVAEEVSSVDLTANEWTLDVTSYTADPENPNDRTGLRTALDTITMDGLTAWNAIEGLEIVSGTGTYQTTFTLDSWDGSQSATLELDTYGNIGFDEECYWSEDGWISYVDGDDGTSAIMTVVVNGTDVGVVNQTTQSVDISEYLVSGENTIEISIATTLYNARYAESGFAYGIETAYISIGE